MVNEERVEQGGQRMCHPGNRAIDDQAHDRQHPRPAPPLPVVPGLAGSPPDERPNAQAGQGQQRSDGEKGSQQHRSPLKREAPPENGTRSVRQWWRWRGRHRPHRRHLSVFLDIERI
jgi:hypothetical protein